jgi:phosphatidylglycerophosphate synthase
MARTLNNIPTALLVLRAVAAPAVLGAEAAGAPGIILAAIVAVAFVSDVFDGIIARRLGVATDSLRSADSIVDTLFYVCAVIALFLRAPAVIDANRVGIAIIVALEVTRQLVERLKFGKMAAYHMWSAKLWGITLFLGFSEVFVKRATGPLFELAIVVGIIADIEGLAASILLSQWHRDVPTLVHAARIEKAARG